VSAPRVNTQMNRRGFLHTSAATAGGLLIGLTLPLRARAAGATAATAGDLTAFVRIGADGRVPFLVPKSEMGQGVYTGLAQVLADELEVDWRSVAVESAPVAPVYNVSFAPMQFTGGSSSIASSFEPLRRAGATARALLIAAGAEQPRDLSVPGRELKGIHFAMDFLPQQNRRVSGEKADDGEPILATGKHVVVIGGGDTGSDCIGTSFRQGAASVTNFEIMPQPPLRENKALTWPNWPLKLRTSSSHEEGAERDFAVTTTHFSGANGAVQKLHCMRVDDKIKPIPGSDFEIKADLVLLAMGFVHPVHDGMVKSLGLKLDQRGNVAASTDDYRTSLDKVFTAGDMRRGQSLVVWAIREGRQAAHAVDKFLMGSTLLPR